MKLTKDDIIVTGDEGGHRVEILRLDRLREVVKELKKISDTTSDKCNCSIWIDELFGEVLEDEEEEKHFFVEDDVMVDLWINNERYLINVDKGIGRKE